MSIFLCCPAVASEFQHLECEPSEYNQKYFTLIAQFPVACSLIFENLHSTADDGLVSALERAADGVLCP